MTTILAFIVIFAILVLAHEFGHFFFAKRAGILVREFSIGMGPKLVAWRHNNTTFTLRLLPLGGYVRMAGWQDEDDEIKPGTQLAIEVDDRGVVTRINVSNKVTLQGGIPVQVSRVDLVDDLLIQGYENGDERTLKSWAVAHDATIIEADGTEVLIAPNDVQFQNAPILKRLLVNFAGPMNSFLLAIVAFMLFGLLAGVGVPNTNQIGAVQANSAAAKAGVQANAYIERINGKPIESFNDIQTTVAKNKQKPMEVMVTQGGKTQTVTIKPNKDGLIGVGQKTTHSVLAAVTYGFTESWDLTTRLVSTLKSMVTGHFSLNQLAGPVGIYTMTATYARGGVLSLLFFMAFLSLNLAIMNLLPIPVLDGGKIVLNLLELIRRKPLSPEKEYIVTWIGVGLLVLLMVSVTINDILRQF